jgi:hypothetical protein
MAKKPFNFGDTTDSAKKALELLKREPGKPRDIELVRAQMELQEWVQKTLFQEQWRRLTVIATHYQADLQSHTGATSLALRLAIDFVPGFSPFAEIRKGRARSVAREHRDLATEVDALITGKGCSAFNACKILSDRKGKWQFKNPEVLEASYHRFRSAIERDLDKIRSAVDKMRDDVARENASSGNILSALFKEITTK